MWLTKENFKIISSITHAAIYSENSYYVHLRCLLDAKVVSNKGVTGRITKIREEEKKEDRYDSIDISWDHGGASYGVFLLWLMDNTPGIQVMADENTYNANKIYY